MTSQFPLRHVTTVELQQLTQVLWSWRACEDCLAERPCETEECPWPRATVLNRFFEFYKDMTASYEFSVRNGQQCSLTSHAELFEIIQELKSNPEVTKTGLLEKLFPDRPARSDQERAVNLAVRVMMMINCSASRQSSALLEHGTQQAPWRSDVTFSQFVTDVFPKTDHPSIPEIKEHLRARKLKKIAGLRFQPTDDLRRHLKLDRKERVIEIFHHTAFLKEHLRRTKPAEHDEPRSMSVSESIKLGVLSRTLALETLSSIQEILFPLNEPKSRSLLSSLTSLSASAFDPDILRFDSISIRHPSEKHLPYYYFGARLAELYEEMRNPMPKGVEMWLERKSGARYVMMATIAGVIFAVFLGMASLALGAYQAWIGYQQWQHPVQSTLVGG